MATIEQKQISPSIIDYFLQLQSISARLGFEKIVFTPTLIKGVGLDNNLILLHPIESGIDLNFKTDRMSELFARLNLLKQDTIKSCTITYNKDENEVQLIEFKGVKLRKLNFRFSSFVDQLPKGIDAEIQHKIVLTKDNCDYIKKAHSSFNSDHCEILSDSTGDDSVIKLFDVNQDTFELKLPQSKKITASSNDKMVYKYFAKQFILLLSQNDDIEILMDNYGILTVPFNGINIYLLPKA